MIKVIVDKMSDMIWMDMVMHCGELNFSAGSAEILKEYNIAPDHIVDYVKSKNFINDVEVIHNELDR